MLVDRSYPKVGDKVSGYRVAYNEGVLIEGVVTRVDRFSTRDGETLTNVDVTTSQGYTDWFGWNDHSKIIQPIDSGQVDNGWCNICRSYCWGNCEAE